MFGNQINNKTLNPTQKREKITDWPQGLGNYGCVYLFPHFGFKITVQEGRKEAERKSCLFCLGSWQCLWGRNQWALDKQAATLPGKPLKWIPLRSLTLKPSTRKTAINTGVSLRRRSNFIIFGHNNTFMKLFLRGRSSIEYDNGIHYNNPPQIHRVAWCFAIPKRVCMS